MDNVVYLVVSGHQASFAVHMAFSTPAAAEAFVREYGKETWVTTLSLDPDITGWRLTEVMMDYKGKVIGGPKGLFGHPWKVMPGGPVQLYAQHTAGRVVVACRYISPRQDGRPAIQEANELRVKMRQLELWPQSLRVSTPALLAANTRIREWLETGKVPTGNIPAR